MSRQNVEIVRGVFEGFQAVLEGRDPGDSFDSVAEDAEWIPASEVPGPPSYRGLDGFAEFMRTWTEDFEHWSMQLERLIDASDNRVVALQHQWATGKGSGVPVESHYAAVFELEDGRVVRMRLYLDPADALEAAGLT